MYDLMYNLYDKWSGQYGSLTGRQPSPGEQWHGWFTMPSEAPFQPWNNSHSYLH